MAAPGGGTVLCALHLGAGQLSWCHDFNEEAFPQCQSHQMTVWGQDLGSPKDLSQPERSGGGREPAEARLLGF